MVDEVVEEKVEVAQEPEEVQHELVVEEEPKIEEVVVEQEQNDGVAEGKEAAANDDSQDSVASPLDYPKESSPASPKPQETAAKPDAEQ